MSSRARRDDAGDEHGRAAGGTEPESVERWPRGISRRASMRSSDVLAALRAEFPAVSHSKLRFLEDQGLVAPVRTASGYRQYSPADVERLRFVLGEQRDRYLPLKVIKEKLDDLDAGVAGSDRPLIPHLVSRDGVASASQRPMDVPTVAVRCHTSVDLIEELIDADVVAVDEHGRLDAGSEAVVVAAVALIGNGLDARHLRAIRKAAQRQLDVIDQLVRTIGRKQSPAAQAKRESMAADLAEQSAQLYGAMLRQGIAALTDGAS